MDNLNIIRKIKLNTLGYYEFTNFELEIMNIINKNLLGLKKLNSSLYNFDFYFKNTTLIFYFDSNTNIIRMNNIYLWSSLYHKYIDEITDKMILDIINYFYNIKSSEIYYETHYTNDDIKTIYENCLKNVVNEKIN